MNAQEHERLRKLIAEACNGWESCWSANTKDDPPPRIDEIREGAGLIEPMNYCS